MKALLLALALALLLSPSAWAAQSPVTTLQDPAVSFPGDASTTITVTNTFQTVFSATNCLATGGGGCRRACQVVNTSLTNAQWVFLGPKASATKATSFLLQPATATVPGGRFDCGTYGVTMQDEVAITGTATDTFLARQE